MLNKSNPSKSNANASRSDIETDLDAYLVSRTIRGLKTSWIEFSNSDTSKLEAPIVMFCHGFPDGPEAWSAQLEFFKEKFHIVAPYVRGCIHSEPASSVERYSEDSILLDHLEILQHVDPSGMRTVNVIGHDLGVVHALNLTRALGARMGKLIVINGTDTNMFSERVKNTAQMRKSWYMGLMQIPLLPELMVQYAPRSCSWIANEIGRLPQHLRQQDSKLFAKKTLGPLNQYRAFASLVLKPKKTKSVEKRIDRPVLILWGRDDGFLEPPTTAEWELVVAKPVIRILEGGHWVHREASDTVNPIILDFLLDSRTQPLA
ncbi:MAG: alpha/beta hydrolase [Proteobacteria bacterium]|nr:alpha/beta hydrolase [Pseudomonadota bacterium]